MAFQKAKALQDAEKSVGQGKIALAIKLYQQILDNDPADVSLFNTIGDLYIRDRNITEGLRQFHKLAEAYTRDGFNVKAIAIYRKISKVDPNSVDTLLKLAELYQLQGLSREAREQYLQATEFFKKRNQIERALEVLRKLVGLDPENINFRNRLAGECEQSGKREDAAQVHLGSAEILLRRDDQVAAQATLKKAAELDPKNSKILILRARVALARQEPEEAAKIINSSPELQSDPAGRRILLDSYLGAGKLPEAEKLVLEVFHANPSEFAPVSTVSALLVEKGDIEEAFQLLSSVAEPAIGQNNAGPLLEALRRIWNKAPKHVPTLELIHRICERTAEESTLPEVLEALGRVYEEAGDLEKAEGAYLKLVEREPENENFHELLNSVQRKLGKEIKPVEFATKEMALATEEEEPPPAPAGVDVRQDAMVKEALENSDLFARYNLPEKAIAELEKVLQFYPDQIDIHRRILEISRKGFPERGAVAASQLARIFTDHGDHETASKYHAIASAKGPLHEIPLPPPPPSKKVEGPAPPAPVPPQAEVTAEFPIPSIAPEELVLVEAAAPPPEATSFDLTPPEAPSELPAVPPLAVTSARAEQTLELDLSGDLEAMAAFGFQAPAPAEPEFLPPPPMDILAPVEIPASPEEPLPPPMIVEEATPAIEPPAAAIMEPPSAAPMEPPDAAIMEPPAAAPMEPPAAAIMEPSSAAPMEPSAAAIMEPPVAAPMEPPAAAIMEPPSAAPMEPPAAAIMEPPDAAPMEPPSATPMEPPAPVITEPPSAAPMEPPDAAPVEPPAAAPMEPLTAAPTGAPTEIPEPPPAPMEEEVPAGLEDSRIEVEFYLENGFFEEARQAVAALEEQYPGSPYVAVLRERVEEQGIEVSPAEPPAQVAPALEGVGIEPPAEFELTYEALPLELQAQVPPADEAAVTEPPADFELAEEPPPAELQAQIAPAAEAVAPEPPATPVQAEEARGAEPPKDIVQPEPEFVSSPESEQAVEDLTHEEWELPTSYGVNPQPEPGMEPVGPAPAMGPETQPQMAEFAAAPPAQEPVVEAPAVAGSGGVDLLGDLAGDLASSMEGFAASADIPPAAPAALPVAAAPPPPDMSQGAAQLSGLLAEMEDPGAAAAAKGDPETHYNLGVAFREMGLLDEAIGEFQKVVKGSGKGNFPTNFLQACSLLAICFMEKRMPAIAVKWYLRALETPALDEEAFMALQYDLGIAYEQAGDSRNALERFIEVYSQNIDFRDVAEKIRELQQKA